MKHDDVNDLLRTQGADAVRRIFDHNPCRYNSFDGGETKRLWPKTDRANDIVTEDRTAQIFAERYGEQLRYCHDTDAWFEWTGTAWRQNKTGKAFQWARHLARELSSHEPDKVRYITSKTAFASGVERYARTDPTFAVTIDVWDIDTMLLGTPGGTVDLRTGILRPSRPADGITKQTAVPPAETSDCPIWLRFLSEATGCDTGLVRFLQQWAGYCLTGETRENALLFVYGTGGNGKTVFLNVITGVMNHYATAASMDTFTASLSDRHPTDLAMLRGARLVTSSETEEGRAWAETRITHRRRLNYRSLHAAGFLHLHAAIQAHHYRQSQACLAECR